MEQMGISCWGALMIAGQQITRCSGAPHLEVISFLTRVQKRHSSVSTFISMMSASKALLKWITASGDMYNKI